MYLGTMSIFWFEYWHYTKQYKRWKVVQCIFVALICPILMSGLIELLQEYCTNGRRGGDWWDFLANSMGVLVSWIFRKKYLI